MLEKHVLAGAHMRTIENYRGTESSCLDPSHEGSFAADDSIPLASCPLLLLLLVIVRILPWPNRKMPRRIVHVGGG